MSMTDMTQYNALAPIYDDVMYDVDYEIWADFIDSLLQIHHPHPVNLLELACGTGSFAIELDKLQCYNILATDKSDNMLDIARRKAMGNDNIKNVTFRQLDFTNINLTHRFDAAIMLFDSINYLHQKDQIAQLLKEVYDILHENGLFIFDFTTPRNSRIAIKTLDKETGRSGSKYKYHRRSSYSDDDRLHSNEFFIQQWDETENKVIKTYRELHQQKIYTFSEIMEILEQSPFQVTATYSGFELKEANENSLRITAVLRCRKIQ